MPLSNAADLVFKETIEQSSGSLLSLNHRNLAGTIQLVDDYSRVTREKLSMMIYRAQSKELAVQIFSQVALASGYVALIPDSFVFPGMQFLPDQAFFLSLLLKST
jgi:hypothetical protein